MLNLGKYSVLGVNVHAVDYDAAVTDIVEHAKAGKPLAVSALAVHGIMTGAMDDVHRRRLNGLDLVVPDGQPVRWALRWLYGLRLPQRVYGPELTLRTAAACAEHGLSAYLYGSKQEVLDQFADRLREKYPRLLIAGSEPSKFRRLDAAEKRAVVDRIRASGASVVFVGLGCPRQEVWVYEYRNDLAIPLLAVGAAFDFHAGTLPQAPRWMQDHGLEWAYRFYQEPRRLWKRYMFLNPLFLSGIALQLTRLRKYSASLPNGTETLESYG